LLEEIIEWRTPVIQKGQHTFMWNRGFEILQNIQNRKGLQGGTPKMEDIITRNTVNKLGTDSKSSKHKDTSPDKKDTTDVDG
jgi:hypothetical protein